MSVPLKVYFTQGNTQDINLYGLQDIDTLVFWSIPSASGNLYDSNGNLTMVQNVALAYMGSLGNYRGIVTTDFSMSVGGGYTLKIDAVDANQSPVAKFHIELPAEVIIRRN